MSQKIITHQLDQVLKQVDRPGNFATSGHFRFYPPNLSVKGIGTIAFPLLPIQAEQLISVASPAPFGRGEETLYDPAVRRTWQINPDLFTLEGAGWQESMKDMVKKVKHALGVKGKVKAEIYKLLIYDTDSFFLEHRDTEKTEGMFATLVVVLPCHYQGGDLCVRHKGQENCYNLQTNSLDTMGYAAFYADCRHEVSPITDGHRLTLVFNLTRDGRGPLPKPAEYQQEQQQVSHLLNTWVSARKNNADDIPKKLIYPLEHAYTPAEIAFSRLKNGDQSIGQIFIQAAQENHCDIYLALVSLEESGSAENHGSYGYYDNDDDDFEIIEAFESTQTLESWCSPDGKRPNLGPLTFREDELCPPDLLSALDATEISFYEATGNEGASYERSYHFAAIVLWPEGRQMEILAQSGPSASLPYLSEISRQCHEEGFNTDRTCCQDAIELLQQIQQQWPENSWQRVSLSNNGQAAQLLTCMTQLKQEQSIIKFIEENVITNAYSQADNLALSQAIGHLKYPTQQKLINAIFTTHAEQHFTACANLLHILSKAEQPDPSLLLSAMQTLFSALPIAFNAMREQSWGLSENIITTESVIDLLLGFELNQSPMARQTITWLFDHAEESEVDKLLLPAALTLKQQATHSQAASVIQLYDGVMNHLGTRIDLPLSPFPNWLRPAELNCQCSQCAQLQDFLGDTDKEQWRYTAAEAKRRHIEDTIQRSQSDVDCSTEKKGRPYTLVCVKNSGSYKRRVTQRQQDEKMLGELRA